MKMNRRLFTVIFGAAAPLLSAGENPGDSAPRATEKTTAVRVMEDLRAAGEARVEYEKVLTRDAEEQARTEVLLQALAAGRERAQRQTLAARRECARIRAETAGAASAGDAMRELEKTAAHLAEKLERELDRSAGRTFPGVVADNPHVAEAGKQPEDGERFHAALARLESAELAAKEWNSEIVSGWLDGQELAVRLLRAGNVAAWWLTLDGKRAGTARMEGEKLLLRPAADAAIAENIARAFAAYAGRLAPDWVTLPLE